MKKRLLITSIVMMLVVAVALSTATYAWFTTSTNVSAEAVVLTASTMDGDAILITHAINGEGMSNTITLSSAQTGRLYPATPKATDTFNNGVTAADFQNLIMNGSGKYVDPSISAPNTAFYSDTFYVFNKGFQSTILDPTVTITYNSNDNTSKMAAMSVRVAILERVGTQAAIGSNVTFGSTYALKGIWQFNGDGTSDTAITDSYSYIRFDKLTSNDEYSNSASYYTAAGVADTEVSAQNFETKVAAGLYIGTEVTVTTENGKVNTAADGANGSSTEASGYGVVAGSGANAGYYTQSNVLFVPADFAAIGVATSGNQIANEYTVVIWLEGWDEDCTNAITSGTFKVALSFDATHSA